MMREVNLLNNGNASLLVPKSEVLSADATIIEEDNQACVYASEIPPMTRGMRHLDLAELLIKKKVDAKEIKLLKVASADNTSAKSK